MYQSDVENVHFPVQNVLEGCSKCTRVMLKMYSVGVACTAVMFRMYWSDVQNVQE